MPDERPPSPILDDIAERLLELLKTIGLGGMTIVRLAEILEATPETVGGVLRDRPEFERIGTGGKTLKWRRNEAMIAALVRIEELEAEVAGLRASS